MEEEYNDTELTAWTKIQFYELSLNSVICILKQSGILEQLSNSDTFIIYFDGFCIHGSHLLQ